MKFVVNDKVEETIMQLQLVEHHWGVSISRICDDRILLELRNSGMLYIGGLGAELFKCLAGVVK